MHIPNILIGNFLNNTITIYMKFRTNKLIYRRYAGLFFTICCDVTDNELVTLEAVHLFVEILDQYFQNVCELDLVFNFHKVYLILDEFIIGGEFQETSKKVWSKIEAMTSYLVCRQIGT